MDRVALREKLASRVEKIRLEEYGIELFVRPLSALERARVVDKYGLLSKDKEKPPLMETFTIENQCFIVCRGLVQENGKRVYGDDEAEKLADEFPCLVLDRLSTQILILSGMDKSPDEQIKNWSPTPSEGSSLGSQRSSDGGTQISS
jgi:hypothetical protein